jgi:riboflavin-specific deaminase-like protein
MMSKNTSSKRSAEPMRSGLRRPRVIANFARTADGKVSTRNLTPSGFTSEADLRRLLEIRASGDAVMVGRHTLAADTMSMTLRDDDLREAREAAGLSPEPLRVIISATGTLDPTWKVFSTPGARRIVFTTQAMPDAVRSALAPLADLHFSQSAELDLAEVLIVLRKDYDVRTVVCEGGPTLFRSLVEIGAIDELRITMGPVVFGGAQAPTLTGVSPEFFPHPVHLTVQSMEVLGQECYLSYRVQKSAA